VLGFDQAVVGLQTADALPEAAGPAPHIAVQDDVFVICGAHFKYRFNRKTACFDAMVFDGENVLERPMAYNIWRAPTDNDRRIKLEWLRCGYDHPVVRVYASSACENGALAVIEADFALTAPVIQRIATLHGRFEIDAAGRVQMTVSVCKTPALPYLPRFGVRLFVNRAYDRASYYGYGPHESYIDKRRASWLDRFEQQVDQMHEDYLRPQENASHYGCADVRLFACGRPDILACGPDGLSFNASRYTQEELTEKAHNYELVQSGGTVLCLDYAQSGIGSNSCGPELLEQYRLPDAFTMQMTLAFEPAQR
jgi:beta-galactosidase